MVVANAVFSSECTGVMPLPAQNATTSSSPAVSRKTPAGRVTSTMSPAAKCSFIQFDTTPSGVRFTVTANSGSTAGEDDME